MLLETVPNAGWQALIAAYPSSHGFVMSRDLPHWRPWAQDGVPGTTRGEAQIFVNTMSAYLLEGVGTDASRWADLIGILRDLVPQDLQEALRLLSERVEALKDLSVSSLRGKLRWQLYLHRSHPDAKWAINEEDVELLAAVYETLTPTDPVAANSWLFAARVDLPEGETQGHVEYAERVSEARKTAVRAVHESHGPEAIAAIANVSEIPNYVGVATALGLGREIALHLALQNLGSSIWNLKDFAKGVLSGLFSQYDWPVL